MGSIQLNLIRYMKFLTILVILLSTTSCTVDWNGKQADKIVSLENEIAELKKEKEQDIFKRKQDCASKISYLKKEVEKNNSEFASKYSFIEVFYSPSESECYFTMWYGDIFNVTEDRLVEVDPYLWVGKTLRVY
mgnify:CR=1 FL=1